MAGDDDIIDEVAVRVSPDLKGFRRKLERELKTQIAGIGLEVPLKINESKQREALNYVAGLRAKYIKDQLARTRNAAEKVGQAQDQARQHELKQVRSFRESVTRLHIQAGEQELKRIRSTSEKIQQARAQAVKGDKALEQKTNVDRQRKDEQFLTFQQKVNAELSAMAKARAEDEISIRHDTQGRMAQIEREGSRLRIAVLAAEEKVEREQLARTEKAEKESLARRNKANADSKKFFRDTPQLIDFGGRGIRPMNLLYGVVAAMSPALIAMGSSALQASTSIAALGSAGIGAALGLSGVVLAFQGIGDLLSLRKQVLSEETAGAANAARDAVRNADDLAQARRGLADAQRDETAAEQDLHKARRDAIRDLEDLKQAVIDLDNQYKSDTISVAEARQNAVATDQNFFATALDRARAWQDVRDAETQQKDTALQRRQKKQDLRSSLAGGIEQSDRVKDARERVRDARDRTLDAQAALRGQSAATAGGIDKVSSASAQLKKKIAELGPAAKNMYDWFVANEEMFKRLRREINNAVLPGFTTFLKAVSSAPKGGKSTLQLAAEYAGQLGGIISKYAGLFGEWTKSPLFRGSMARIQTSNAKAFDKLGQAMLVLADPLLRIVDKAAPGFESLADVILDLSTRFAAWIKQLDESGALTKWFTDSRVELEKWWDIIGNVATIFKNIFTASLPSGSSLVTSFRDFTQTIADWTASPGGQKSLKDFFQFFKDLPYAKIIDFFKNAVIMFAALRTLKFAYAHPFVTALTAFAAANPAAAAAAFSGIGTAIGKIVETIVAHPDATTAIITMLALAKAGKVIGFDIKIPVINSLRDALISRFKVLDKFVGGGATTATMNVQAGVVNVYGGAGIPAAGGAAGKAGKVGAFASLFANVGLAAAVAIIVYAVDKYQERRAYIKTTMGGEEYAFGNLQADIQRYGPLGQTPNDRTVVNRKAVTDYIAARKKNVAAAIEEAKATGGVTAAKRVELVETQKSVNALSTMLQQYGWTKDKADAYSRAVYDLNGLLVRNRQENESAAAALKAAGTEADTATKKFKDLNTEVTNLAGEKNIILTVDGKPTVIKDLEDVAAYQQLIRQGKPPTESNLRKEKLQYERTKNLATGGKVPGHSPNDKADNIPAMLTANEYVQPVAAVRHYGTDFMEAVRTRRFPRYAAGGQVEKWPFPVKLPDALKPIKQYTDIYDPAVGPVPGLGAGMSPGTWQGLWAAVKGNFARASLYSAFRRGSKTLSGNPSRHSIGKAIDVSPTRSIAEWIYRTHGKRTYELISPWTELNLYRGRPHKYSRAVEIQHGAHGDPTRNAHVHWSSYADGGLARKYDQGGLLPPGFSTVYNGTGRNETVRTERQEQALAGTGTTRLDRRDLALLAQYVATATANPTITMDGRRVAETTNRYNYLPAGV